MESGAPLVGEMWVKNNPLLAAAGRGFLVRFFALPARSKLYIKHNNAYAPRHDGEKNGDIVESLAAEVAHF